MSEYAEMKQKVLDCIMFLVERGFVQGTGGNVSMRSDREEVMAVTPSQKEYAGMTADDICIVDFDLRPVEDNGLRPSMESGMHVAVYRNRPDVNAVVHTHQVCASVFSLIDTPIPALFDEVANSIGRVVDVVPYGLSGSPQLLANVASKLGNRCMCYIIQNHGALSLGADIASAQRNAELLEKCARVYCMALAAGKEITRLPAEIEDLLQKLLEAKQDAEIARKKGL